jgi:hypothetical protein
MPTRRPLRKNGPPAIAFVAIALFGGALFLFGEAASPGSKDDSLGALVRSLGVTTVALAMIVYVVLRRPGAM